MPIPNAKYRVKHTSKGNVRLAFVNGKVVEAKNLKTGDTSKITGIYGQNGKKKRGK